MTLYKPQRRPTGLVYTPEQAAIMIKAGTRCEHCGALHVIRRRSLNSTMARQLAAIYRYYRDPLTYRNLQLHMDDERGHWLHVYRYLTYLRMDNGCSKLRFWGFTEEHPDDKEDGNPHNGYFRLTSKGKKFCELKFKTYRYIMTKNQGEGFVGFIDGDMVDLIEAGRNHFNYAKEIG